ncbi:MAG: thioesterase domain-containing protein [Parvularculaceae bacterium]
MPTMLGLGSTYGKLAQKLEFPGEVLSCRLPGVEPGEAALDRIEDIAEYCRHSLIKPEHDEWSLIGWSFGGVVAYDVARQMQDAGLNVRQVILVDSLLPKTAADLSSLTEEDFDLALRLELGSELVDNLNIRAILPMFRAHHAAMTRYLGGGYCGEVTEIRTGASEKRLGRAGASALRPVHDGEINLVRLAGDHYSILARENLDVLAGAIDEILSKPKIERAPQSGESRRSMS